MRSGASYTAHRHSLEGAAYGNDFEKGVARMKAAAESG
jgi:hypothetical protein